MTESDISTSQVDLAAVVETVGTGLFRLEDQIIKITAGNFAAVGALLYLAAGQSGPFAQHRWVVGIAILVVSAWCAGIVAAFEHGRGIMRRMYHIAFVAWIKSDRELLLSGFEEDPDIRSELDYKGALASLPTWSIRRVIDPLTQLSWPWTAAVTSNALPGMVIGIPLLFV